VRLLLIEDDERIARMVGRALHEEGYQVSHAADGPAGLHAAQAEPFDLIILDLMLPGMDGTVVLRKLMERDPRQRVLVLSAVPEVATRVACLELGAADFVGKPFSLDELLARVRARTREGAPGPASERTMPSPTGSTAIANTIGIVEVTCAEAAAALPVVTSPPATRHDAACPRRRS